MDKPKLTQHQYAVGQADLATGHVLKNNKSLYLNREGIVDAFQIFNSFTHAKEFCIQKVLDNPEIECFILDSNGNTIFACDLTGERNLK